MTRRTFALLGAAFGCLATLGLLLGFGIEQPVFEMALLFAGLDTALLAIVLDNRPGELLRTTIGVILICILAVGGGYASGWVLQRTYRDRPLLEMR